MENQSNDLIDFSLFTPTTSPWKNSVSDDVFSQKPPVPNNHVPMDNESVLEAKKRKGNFGGFMDCPQESHSKRNRNEKTNFHFSGSFMRLDNFSFQYSDSNRVLSFSFSTKEKKFSASARNLRTNIVDYCVGEVQNFDFASSNVVYRMGWMGRQSFNANGAEFKPQKINMPDKCMTLSPGEMIWPFNIGQSPNEKVLLTSCDSFPVFTEKNGIVFCPYGYRKEYYCFCCGDLFRSNYKDRVIDVKDLILKDEGIRFSFPLPPLKILSMKKKSKTLCCLGCMKKRNEKEMKILRLRIDEMKKTIEVHIAENKKDQVFKQAVLYYQKLQEFHKEYVNVLKNPVSLLSDKIFDEVQEYTRNDQFRFKSRWIKKRCSLKAIKKMNFEKEWKRSKELNIHILLDEITKKRKDRGVKLGNKETMIKLHIFSLIQKLVNVNYTSPFLTAISLRLSTELGDTAMRLTNHIGSTLSPPAMKTYKRKEKEKKLKTVSIYRKREQRKNPTKKEMSYGAWCDNSQKLQAKSVSSMSDRVKVIIYNAFTTFETEMASEELERLLKQQKELHQVSYEEFANIMEARNGLKDFILKDYDIFMGKIEEEELVCEKEEGNIFEDYEKLVKCSISKYCSKCDMSFTNRKITKCPNNECNEKMTSFKQVRSETKRKIEEIQKLFGEKVKVVLDDDTNKENEEWKEMKDERKNPFENITDSENMKVIRGFVGNPSESKTCKMTNDRMKKYLKGKVQKHVFVVMDNSPGLQFQTKILEAAKEIDTVKPIKGVFHDLKILVGIVLSFINESIPLLFPSLGKSAIKIASLLSCSNYHQSIFCIRAVYEALYIELIKKVSILEELKMNDVENPCVDRKTFWSVLETLEKKEESSFGIFMFLQVAKIEMAHVSSRNADFSGLKNAFDGLRPMLFSSYHGTAQKTDLYNALDYLRSPKKLQDYLNKLTLMICRKNKDKTQATDACGEEVNRNQKKFFRNPTEEDWDISSVLYDDYYEFFETFDKQSGIDRANYFAGRKYDFIEVLTMRMIFRVTNLFSTPTKFRTLDSEGNEIFKNCVYLWDILVGRMKEFYTGFILGVKEKKMISVSKDDCRDIQFKIDFIDDDFVPEILEEEEIEEENESGITEISINIDDHKVPDESEIVLFDPKSFYAFLESLRNNDNRENCTCGKGIKFHRGVGRCTICRKIH